MKLFGGKGILALAVVLAAGTSFMAYRYLERAGAPAPAPKPIESSSVVTAAKDVPERTVLTSDMIKLSQLPSTAKLPGAATTIDQVAGKVTREPLNAGEQVQINHLFPDRADSGLTFVVPPGRRAVSVAVNEVVGSGGMIQPGDFVDVVAVVDIKANNEQTQTPGQQPATTPTPTPASRAEMVAASQYIVQNVEVLAVAQSIEGVPAEQSVASKLSGSTTAQQPAPGNAQPAAHTVTLSVTAEEAQRLVLGEDKGRIRLVLRPYGDQTVTTAQDEGLFTNYRGISILKNAPRPL